MAGVAGSHAAAAGEPCPAGPDGRSFAVADVVDGATLRLDDGRLVRLAGIEAPLAPVGAQETWPLAAEARRHLAHLVNTPAVRLVAAGEEPDRYGRQPAYVFAGGELLQAKMVTAGLARVRWLPGEGACLAKLLAVEGVARAAGTGLWGAEAYRPVSARDPSLSARTGLYAIVQGRVVSVGRGYSLVFIDFGRDFRRDFSVLIPLKLAEQMEDEGQPLENLVGKSVEVRGMIEQNNGPAIRLNDPAEIAVVRDGG